MDITAENYYTYSDRGLHGGSSVATATHDNKGHSLDCQLVDGYQWPFCEILFELTDEQGMGYNLSHFTFLNADIEMTYNGELSENYPVRIYFKHFANSNYGMLDYKPNLIEFDVSQYPDGISLPMDYLQVPDWWRVESRVDVMRSYRELSNVKNISISTPSEAPLGEYKIWVKKLELVGPLMPVRLVNSLLLMVWLIGLTVLLGSYFYYTRRDNNLLNNENKRLLKMATRDELTNTLNRHGAQQVLALGDNIKRNNLAIIYFDIDFFKVLNDSQGHDAGDKVLQVRNRSPVGN